MGEGEAAKVGRRRRILWAAAVVVALTIGVAGLLGRGGQDRDSAPIATTPPARVDPALTRKVAAAPHDRFPVVISLRQPAHRRLSGDEVREGTARLLRLAHADSGAPRGDDVVLKRLPFVGTTLDAAGLRRVARSPDAELVTYGPGVQGVPSARGQFPDVNDIPIGNWTGAPEAWIQDYTGEGQTIAIIDTDIDFRDGAYFKENETSVACFSGPETDELWAGCTDQDGRSVPGPEFGPGVAKIPTQHWKPPDADDDEGLIIGELGANHGTYVTQVAAGAARTYPIGKVPAGHRGVAPDAGVMAVGIGNPKKDFRGVEYRPADLLAALDHVLLESRFTNVAALNISLGFPELIPEQDEYCDAKAGRYAVTAQLRDAFYAVINSGISVTAAPANEESEDGLDFPSCQKRVIAVGSATGASNYDPTWARNTPHSPLLDVLAPGALAVADRTLFGGNSASAPMVAGAIALLRQKSPSLTPDQIVRKLTTTGLTITLPADTWHGPIRKRVLDVDRLLSLPASPTTNGVRTKCMKPVFKPRVVGNSHVLTIVLYCRPAPGDAGRIVVLVDGPGAQGKGEMDFAGLPDDDEDYLKNPYPYFVYMQNDSDDQMFSPSATGEYRLFWEVFKNKGLQQAFADSAAFTVEDE